MNIKNEIGISLFDDGNEPWIEEIKKHIIDGEEIFTSVFDGRGDTQSVFLFTNKKLMIIETKVFGGFSVDSYLYKSITGIDVDKMWIVGVTLSISSKNTEDPAMFQVHKSLYDECLKMKNEILSYMDSLSNSNQVQSASSQSVSAADEIKKLADLRDTGILTDEEFEAKKKQLLGL